MPDYRPMDLSPNSPTMLGLQRPSLEPEGEAPAYQKAEDSVDVGVATTSLEDARGDIEQTRQQPFVDARSITVDLPSGTSKIGNPRLTIPVGIVVGIPSAAVYVYQTPADVAATTNDTIQITTSGACTVTLWVL